MPYKDKICGIYAIVRIGTTDCYVGQSVHIHNRWRQHRAKLASGDFYSLHMQRVFDKCGIDAFEFKILEVVSPADLTGAEQKWIDQLKPIFNSLPATCSHLGMKRSEEVRKNISIAQKKRFERPEQRAQLDRTGKPSPWKGKTPSEEARAKMSAAASNRESNFGGRKHSEESLQKMRSAKLGRPSPNKGRPRSVEANRKQSLAMIGRTPWNKGLKTKEQACQRLS